MDVACRMLIEGTPLAEVAQACGFADQSHFTRAFAATFGVVPGLYRRQWRTTSAPTGGMTGDQPRRSGRQLSPLRMMRCSRSS